MIDWPADAAVSGNAVALACALGAGAYFLLWRFPCRQATAAGSDNCNNYPTVPEAPGAVPILGHALKYQEDPPKFLRQCACRESSPGSVFAVNLAGRRMIVIGADATAHHQVANAAESVLSARQAVAEIGFQYTLGARSVQTGTDFHKLCLKNEILTKLNSDSFKSTLLLELEHSLEWEMERLLTKEHSKSRFLVPDLFYLLRRCFLRTMLNTLVGSCILEDHDDAKASDSGDALVTQFMQFQEHLEDATAQGAVLPHWVARMFVWQPVAWERQRLQAQLAQRIQQAATKRNDTKNPAARRYWGPWLATFASQNSNMPQLDEIAELIVGLIFAAHKNPAIGAAQSLCFLLNDSSEEERQAAQEEAKRWLAELRQQPKQSTSSCSTLQACVLETMCLTSHSIGSVRRAMRPFVLNTDSGATYSIEEGATLCDSHILQTTDTAVWGDEALQFNPKRFARLNNNSDKKAEASTTSKTNNRQQQQSKFFTTFSAGVHKCPGEKLALPMMELALALLLERDATLTSSAMPPLSFERATLAQRQGPVAVSLLKAKKKRNGKFIDK